MQGPDKEKWQASLEKENKFLEDRGTFQQLPNGWNDLPPGIKPLRIVPKHKIKDDGTFKTRQVVLGNEEEWFDGRYSPTVSKAVIWLIFALTVLLRLKTRYFDISGAFLAEKPERDIYVLWKNAVCLLKLSLYGLGDAPKLFNEGLVEHLKNGGYTQSTYEPCLFYKWKSISSFIYIIFHVDDFNAAANNEQDLDIFAAHLSSKYTVTSNENGIFLGIHQTEAQSSRSHLSCRSYSTNTYQTAQQCLQPPQRLLTQHISKA
jgi:hypothetical protein